MNTRWLIVVVLLGAGCHGMSLEEHEMASRGLSREDLEAGANDNEIRARIVTDVRQTWLPEAYLDHGRADCPALGHEGGKLICIPCKASKTELKMFTLRDDPLDRQSPVRETAYFCPTESVYWYHYQGGDKRLDTWLGPRRVRLRQARGVPGDH